MVVVLASVRSKPRERQRLTRRRHDGKLSGRLPGGMKKGLWKERSSTMTGRQEGVTADEA